MLMKSGALPNVRRSDGQTPLHIAAKCGNTEMAQLLLNEGADPSIKSTVKFMGRITPYILVYTYSITGDPNSYGSKVLISRLSVFCESKS
jgi:ankyrin repeat protein